MDLLRSTIKALFYDFNPASVAEVIMNSDNMALEEVDQGFYGQLSELLSWREDKFTSSEAFIYTNLVKDELLKDDETGFIKDGVEQYSAYERIFLILAKCGERILDVYGHRPKVRFENLLRWRDLSLFIGEDAMVISTLARHDVVSPMERTDFLWPVILGHNNMIINHVLRRTLSDTHAHLWASTNIFEFNWLAAMNHPDILSLFQGKEEETGFLASGFRRYYDRVFRHNAINFSLAEWIVIAAAIRIRIYLILSDPAYRNNPGMINGLMDLDFSKPNLRGELVNDFKGLFDGVIDKAAKTADGIPIDYAVTGTPDSSPFSVLEGERKILYRYFHSYFAGDRTVRRLAPWMYLYLLIRNKVRREFIQVNGLKGFLNFQTYQDIKLCFIDILDKKSKSLATTYQNAALRYAIQSSIIGSTLNNFEARITPGSLNYLENTDYRKAIFGPGDVLSFESQHLSFVIHFIKIKDERKFTDQEGEIRHRILREQLRDCLTDLELRLEETLQIPVVGFDAAGNELMTEPEVFAPAFRQLRKMGYTNLTYHVGEDFYDIIHGLRSIDEAIEFLELTTGNRIGHGIALGVDACRYYRERHHFGVLPKQVLLDNCVWFRYTAMQANVTLQPETQLFIDSHFEKLSDELGYKEAVVRHGNMTMFHYWESMKLRGLDPLEDNVYETVNGDMNSLLLRHYWESGIVYVKGAETVSVELPRSLWIDVEKIQQFMIRKIERKGITIETNPSSNVMIGPFNRYEDLPLFRLHPPGYNKGIRIPVTVNTDDKGIFATSLENEYSIVALSLRKMTDDDGNRKWNDKEIEEYLRQLAEYGDMTRFRTA